LGEEEKKRDERAIDISSTSSSFLSLIRVGGRGEKEVRAVLYCFSSQGGRGKRGAIKGSAFFLRYFPLPFLLGEARFPLDINLYREEGKG